MRLDNLLPKETARVEMIPLMDVVFLLLVFFIYAFLSMSVQKGLQVNLPKAAGESVTGPSLQIVITADNRLYFEEKPVDLSTELVGLVAERYRERGEPVLIRADGDARLGPAIELMSELKSAGVDRVTCQVSGKPRE